LHELGSPEVCGKEMKRLFQLFILAGINIFCFMAGSAQAEPALATKEKMTMIAAQAKPNGLVPPMDRSAPARTQTATFALG
jgi:hypothetical protein